MIHWLTIDRRFPPIVTAFALLAFICPACALDPNREMSQYIHDSWNASNGFKGGQISAIAQTPDGYLWIGAEKGLFRFDGLKFLPVQDSSSPSTRITHVLGLTTSADGGLWIRTEGPNVLHYHDGKFENAISAIGSTESGVTAMSKAKDGGILLSTLVHGVLRYSNGGHETLIPPNRLHNLLTLSLAETSDRKIWLGTRDDGLFYLSGGQAVAVNEGLPDRKINCLLPIDNGRLWIGTDNGIALWDGSRIAKTDISTVLGHVQVLAMTQDHDANLWVSTPQRLLRFDAHGVSPPSRQNQLLHEQATALFEDREGNLWVGNTNGLERFRDGAFTTYSTAEGLPSETSGPIYVDAEQRVWIAPSNGGLLWMQNGNVRDVTTAGLSSDIVYSIAGDEDGIWIGRQRGGLTHLRPIGNSFVAETFATQQGLAQNSVYSVHANRDGTVWAGTLSGGASRLKEGRFTTYTTADGLASNTITAMEETREGAMWFATPGGLSTFSDGHWRTYAQSDGLPSDDVICLLQGSEGVLWIGTANGLAALTADKIYSAPEAPDPLHEPVFGLTEDREGFLWIATSNHVLRVNRRQYLQGTFRESDVREYGLEDGLYGNEGVKRDQSVVSDPGGRVWFSLNRGISVVDPSRTGKDSASAIAHIEAITADGNPVEMQTPVQIPSSRQRVVFDYTGLSLAVPERVRFRYRLDGFDHGWSEPVATRRAIYTNLGPGSYRFRVAASNSAGEWNGSEATLPFKIQPTFWQTGWFQATCVVALACIVWILYRIRMHYMVRQLNVRFEERLAERMRIAQELHDTLLQGFLSASMQLHVVADQVPENSPAKPLLGRVLQLMGQVIDEGRNALRGLRSSSRDSHHLEHAFSHIPQELAPHDEVSYRVIVDGQPRTLHPVIRDEVYRIGREALVNAFRHAQAKSIEVEIEYTAGHLRTLIRDDGRGIDPQVLRSGREGHWGLPGMRERAERIGAKLKVWSRSAAGTEVELIVPGKVAYPHRSGNGRFRWLAGLHPQKGETKRVSSKNE